MCYFLKYTREIQLNIIRQMKIGLISDTHNNIELTVKALDRFRTSDVDIVVHAGDFTSPDIIRLFRDFDCKFVLGNCDVDIENMCREAEECGFSCLSDICEFYAGDKHILVIHGDNVSVFREAVASGKYEYIIKGHTHLFEDYVSNNVRIINPGSLMDSKNHYIVILDTVGDSVERISILS